MKFSTIEIKNNLKSICSVGSDYVYIDVANQKIYFSNEHTTLRLNVPFEDVTDEKVFVISNNDFIHICSFADNVELKSDYSYIAGVAKGKFTKNDDFIDVLDSLKVAFEQKDEYTPMFTVDENILKTFNKASIYIDENAININSRYLHIKDGYIFSSSSNRIYLGKIENVSDTIISNEVIKNIFTMGIGTQLFNNSDSYLLIKDNVEIYVCSNRDVDYLPVLEEKFKSKCDDVMNTTEIVVDVAEFMNKLTFMSFYAKNSPSNVIFLNYHDGKASLSCSENNIVDIKIEKINEEHLDAEYRLPFNCTNVMDILSKLAKDKTTVSIFASKDSSKKLFIIKLSDEEETILTKINA